MAAKKTNKASPKKGSPNQMKSKKPAPKKAAVKISTKTSAKAKAPVKEAKVSKAAKPADTAQAKRKQAAAAAMKAALSDAPSTEDEEFDPAAFFAASGGKGEFRAHVMRKERVEFNLAVRYRFIKGPLVFNAELLNLSKGGLCLRTPDVIKNKIVLRIEIPLPHTSELFAVQAEVIWSDQVPGTTGKNRPVNTGLRFLVMSLAKQTVINSFIQQRRDQLIMSKIGLNKFSESAPVAGLD